MSNLEMKPLLGTKRESLTGVLPFAFTIFLSAFLLFQIQPLISRYILPWFGGTPSVWSASLLFFQTLLLGGYAFAHWLSNRKKWQLRLYLALLAISFIILMLSTIRWGSPLLPGSYWKPADNTQPFIRIIMILIISVGLPYFLLSTTSPLLQSWFKIFYPDRTPYRLYALSNFGSFLGLITYPFIFEPLFRLREQSWIWFAGYLIYTGLCGYVGKKILSIQEIGDQGVRLSNATEPRLSNDASMPSPIQKILWIALAACTSILLLSITNQLTQEVAVIPFLWVLPLSIYLISFMVSFSGEKWYPQSLLIGVLAIATLGVGYTLNMLTTTGMFYQILIFVLFLLISTLVCHGELYRLRPDSRHLTSFYLYISLGGVVGGLFVNLIAPIIFKGYWELHLGILLCWVLIIILQFTNRPSVFDKPWISKAILPIVLILGGSGVLFIRHINNTMSGVLNMQRNFYGVIRVRSIGIGDPQEVGYSLNHGTTSHGFQFREDEKRSIPTTYYGRQSGIGLALTHYQNEIGDDDIQHGMRVGVIGLGTGTLAAYGDSVDTFRFYEINPKIIELALGDGEYFSFLADSLASYEIVLGDARISMENELQNGNPQDFDILVVDAFSSDAIPIHLLTVEAIEIYLQHLQPKGVLAIHISNRYLNLAPLVGRLAEHFQLDHALIRNVRDESTGSYTSAWILLSRNQDFFKIPDIMENSINPIGSDPEIRIWTDDYSNLLPLIKKDVFTKIR